MRCDSMYRQWSRIWRAYALGSLLLLVPLVSGCGGGNINTGPTLRGAVLLGTSATLANTQGADGLTPVGTGTKLYLWHDDGVNDTNDDSPTTDSQGRFHFQIQNNKALEYYIDVADRCSTVSGIEIGPDNKAFVVYNPNNNDGQYPPDGLQQRAQQAAAALGLDVVILVDTDVATCSK